MTLRLNYEKKNYNLVFVLKKDGYKKLKPFIKKENNLKRVKSNS